MNPIFGTKSNSEIMNNSQIYSEDKGSMIEGNEMGIVAHQILEMLCFKILYICRRNNFCLYVNLRIIF